MGRLDALFRHFRDLLPEKGLNEIEDRQYSDPVKPVRGPNRKEDLSGVARSLMMRSLPVIGRMPPMTYIFNAALTIGKTSGTCFCGCVVFSWDHTL
jgi:hypothetical protein